MLAGPGIYLIYMVAMLVRAYDGRCWRVLESGPECTLTEFIWSELTSPFFLSFFALTTLAWIAAIGISYFGVSIFRHVSKSKEKGDITS